MSPNLKSTAPNWVADAIFYQIIPDQYIERGV